MKQLRLKKSNDFSKKDKVSVWVSQYPYQDIPDDYFEETFDKEKTRANNAWSDNFKLEYFHPDDMETNGALKGTVNILKAAGECSFSHSYIEALLSKARQNNCEQVTWIIMLFDYEYSIKSSGVVRDEYVTFLGAFEYNDAADNVIEIE